MIKPLEIKLNCPRQYETATEYWEESGVHDHCAGCGGTKAEHVAETNAIIMELEITDELSQTNCLHCDTPPRLRSPERNKATR